MILDHPASSGLRRGEKIDLLLAASFFAGLALTAIAGAVLARHALFAGSGVVAVMFALNLVVLVRFLWQPAHPLALLVSKLAVQFMTMLASTLALFGLVLVVADFAALRGFNPAALLVAVALLALWSAGCAIIAHRDWNSLLQTSQPARRSRAG